MPSAEFRPLVNGDDGFWSNSNGTIVAGDTFIYFGYGNDVYYGGWQDYNTFVRFPSVNIPQGATITSAVIACTSGAIQVGSGTNIDIFFNAVDDAVAPTDVSEAEGKALTSAKADWTIGADWSYGPVDTPSLVSALQEVISRAGWVSGNAILALFRNDSSTATRRFASLDNTDYAEAILSVSWTVSSQSNEIPVAPLVITPHAPTYWMSVVSIPVVALLLTAGVPSVSPQYFNVPVTPLAISAPMNTEGALFQFSLADLPGEGQDMYAVASNGSIFCGVGWGKAYTSPDGIQWTQISLPAGIDRANAITWGNGQFVVVGGEYSAQVATSPDGINWTAQTPPSGIVLHAVTWGNGQFVAAGNSKFATSPDGINWTVREVPPAVNTCAMRGVTWTGSRYVAVGYMPGNTTLILTSTDGIDWTINAHSIPGTLRGVAWSGTGLCAVGYAPPTAPLVFTSPDGIYWTVRDSGVNGILLFAVGWVGSGFAAVGTGVHAVLMTSPSGDTWTQRDIPVTIMPLTAVAWNGINRMVVVGPGESEHATVFYALAGAEPFRSYGASQVSLAGIEISVFNPSWRFQTTSRPPIVPLALTVKNPSAVWDLIASMRPAAQVIYYCILTGANESPALPDLFIPISSFQARIRNGEPSYLSCVIPNPSEYSDEIAARSNGEIIIQKGYRLQDGSINMAEIVRVDYETLALDIGARSASGTIVGHKTVTASAAKEWTVQGVSFYGLQHDGKRRIRAAMDLFLHPGDIVIYGAGDDDSFTVGSITYIVNTRDGLMEVTEA